MMDYDVAIVGGGIAGCTTAIYLAKAGWRVIVFESKSYPHHKVCGEFLSPECELILTELDVMDQVRAVNPASINQVLITSTDGYKWESPLPASAIGISRYKLDAILADRARTLGVMIRENTTVTRIDGNLETGFTLTAHNMAVRSRVAIGAHGKRSNFDRALNRSFLQFRQPFIGIKAHFEGIPVPGRVELHGFPGGYCGLSEIEDGKVNLCLLARVEVFRKYSSIPEFITWMKNQNPYLNAWLAGSTQVSEWLSIAQVPFINKNVTERDILMVGDSAGLIAPLAGNGMSMAMYSGERASKILHFFLQEAINPHGLRLRYQTAWRDSFTSRLQLGKLLQFVLLRPNLLSTSLRVVSKIPKIGNFFILNTRERVNA